MEITQKIVALKLPEMERKLVASKKPTDSDPTWYDLYSDGKVEQGGVAQGPRGTVNLPVEMADTNYSIQATVKNSISAQSVHEFQARTPTTTTIPYECSYAAATTSGAATEQFYWQVNGYAAESEYVDKIVRREFIAY